MTDRDTTSPETNEPRRSVWQRMGDWFRDRSPQLTIIVLVVLLILIYLAPSILYNVLPGQAAVIWYRFFGGTDVVNVRNEGIRVKFPWDKVYIYNIRLRQETREFTVLTSDGLPVGVETSVRFRVHRQGLGALHKHVGPDYVETLLMPELAAHIREQISEYRPSELYAFQREEIQAEVLEQLQVELLIEYELGDAQSRALHIEDVLINNIALPGKVEEAIKDKLAQEQRMLEYDYRLEKEEKEKRRKQIEAQGIRLFQDIVSEGISEQYLKWKGIEATLMLAQSPNAKIVVIGAGDDGLPIILGGIDSLPTSAVGAAAGNPAGGNPAGAASDTPPPTPQQLP